jgi:hypothetical protein
MTNASASPAAPAKRRFLPRFSLRVLLLAVTAFAIGFPIWYRWPYEEEAGVTWAKDAAGKDDHSQPPETRRVKTWQRQWGGGRLQHGEERYYVRGKLREVQMFRDGVLQGPFQQFAKSKETVSYEGQFKDGKKDGAWRKSNPDGSERSREEYRDGRLVRTVSTDKQGVEHVIEMFGDGSTRMIIGGVEFEDRLQRLAAEGRIDDKGLRERLSRPVNIEFVNTPIRDAVFFLATEQGLPIVLDPHLPNPNEPTNGKWNDLPLSIVLTAITGPSGHACDFRYGFLWVTTAEDAQDWHDPTGVGDLAPPKDSQLAKSLNEPVNVNAFNTPLAEVLASTVERLDIDVDTSRLGPSTETAPAHPVTLNLMRIKFQHALGMLLYQTRCRCKLEGEKLVILPPEEMP